MFQNQIKFVKIKRIRDKTLLLFCLIRNVFQSIGTKVGQQCISVASKLRVGVGSCMHGTVPLGVELFQHLQSDTRLRSFRVQINTSQLLESSLKNKLSTVSSKVTIGRKK